ncbi:hypothetical protein [Pontibaca methylaminivorans]|uniref:Inner membrane protein n=1 Tax=Pontibaca methylaminivorans TaxID=515897 RepID=A0A1R3WW79_9RHOB|nr:hypothetical protein [Pontibaca methylaminivorans]SIT81079.1 hypothetical protein SAMN05421849_1420 [Pontibaca methylaminivorans]
MADKTDSEPNGNDKAENETDTTAKPAESPRPDARATPDETNDSGAEVPRPDVSPAVPVTDGGGDNGADDATPGGDLPDPETPDRPATPGSFDGARKSDPWATGAAGSTPPAPESSAESPAESLIDDRPEDAADKTAADKTDVPGALPGLDTQDERAAGQRRGGFLPALLGGVLAALLGFFAGRADLIDRFLPEDLRSSAQSGDLADLRGEIAARDEAIRDLRAGIDSLQAMVGEDNADDTGPDMSALTEPLSDQIAELSGRLDDTDTAIAALDERIERLGNRPAGAAPDELAADWEVRLDTLRETMSDQVAEQMSDQRAEMETLLAEARRIDAEARAREAAAESAAQAATGRDVLAQIRAALDSGRPYADQLRMLDGTGLSPPPALAGSAAEGVATLNALQSEFPPAAREALAAVRAQDDGSRSFGTFLQRQLGARSVAPREGDDPDAILSRAEAELNGGNLEAALEELDMLPETAEPALAEWRARAEGRLAAIRAADDLAQSLNSN